MNRSPLMQTSTPVHSTKEMMAMRKASLAKEQSILSSLSLLAQALVGMALYLYDHVSTPGYLSIFLGLPLLILILWLSLYLYRRAPQGCVLALAGPFPGRLLGAILTGVFLLDSQMAAFAISALLSDALPYLSPFLTMLAVSLMLAAAIAGDDPYALPRLGRLLRWPMLAALVLCGLAALHHGSVSYLFPALGEGAPTILKGSLWMSGGLAGACCPLILPLSAPRLFPLQQENKLLYRPLLGAGLFCCLYGVLAACTLPFYALARPESLGWRLLLFTKISGSALTWSLLLFTLLFLLLITLSAGILRAAEVIGWMQGKKKPSAPLICALLLLIAPAASLKALPVQQFLISMAPFRSGAVLLTLIVLWICARRRGKICPQEQEEQP